MLCGFNPGGFQDYVWKCHGLQQAWHYLPQSSSKTLTFWDKDLEPGMHIKVLFCVLYKLYNFLNNDSICIYNATYYNYNAN